jgi:hypothetical protein
MSGQWAVSTNRISEGEMNIIQGKVREFLFSPLHELCGFVIDGGLEVHFGKESSVRVTPLLSIGSSVEIIGYPRHGRALFPELTAHWITNLDSGRSIQISRFPWEPEASSANSTPSRTVPLALPPSDSSAQVVGSFSQNGADEVPEQESGTPSVESTTLGEKTQKVRAPNDQESRPRTVQFIEGAHDALHHTQALLTYLRILGCSMPRLLELFDVAKHNYDQALAHYDKGNFSVAFEYASACREFCRTIDIHLRAEIRTASRRPARA